MRKLFYRILDAVWPIRAAVDARAGDVMVVRKQRATNAVSGRMDGVRCVGILRSDVKRGARPDFYRPDEKILLPVAHARKASDLV